MMSRWTRVLWIAAALLIVSALAWGIFAAAHRAAHEGAKFYYNRGLGEKAASNHTNAIADFDRTLRLDPKYLDAYVARAQSKNANNDLPGALTDLNRALQLDPKYTAAHLWRGYLEPNLDQALAALNRAIELNPQSARAYGVRSTVERYRDDLDAALRDSNRAIELDPIHDDGWRERSMVKVLKGDGPGALADIDKAIELAPNRATNYAVRSSHQVFLGDAEAALKDVNHAIGLAPQNSELLRSRAWVKETTGDVSGAIADLNQVIQLDPEKSLPYFNLGNAAYLNRDWPAALSAYQQSIEKPARNKDYEQFYIWVVLARTGRRQDADTGLAQFLEKRPSMGSADWGKEIANFLLGHLAEDQFLSAAKPSNAQVESGRVCEAWFFIGIKSLLAGNQSAGIDDFKKCLATQRRDYVEYTFAQSELKALQP